MKFISKLLILLTISGFAAGVNAAQAETKKSFWSWGKKYDSYRAYKKYDPYLENARHVQIPQWVHEDWYAEDWLSQKDGMELIKGFYKADILKDQITNKKGQAELIVGPNFYRLSGYDKRRVTHIVDVVYGITSSKTNNVFMVKDWYTHRPIGVFDEYGLRLH